MPTPEEQHRTTLEEQFHEDMLRTYREAGTATGYWANRFLPMVRRRGGVEAAKRLLARREAGIAGGLQVLIEHDRLDLSTEALVLRPEYAELFTEDEKAEARRRLDEARLAQMALRPLP